MCLKEFLPELESWIYSTKDLRISSISEIKLSTSNYLELSRLNYCEVLVCLGATQIRQCIPGIITPTSTDD